MPLKVATMRSPAPEPDDNFADVPEITFDEPVSSADAAPLPGSSSPTICGRCNRMKAEGVPEAIKAAGYAMPRAEQQTHEPHPDVTSAHQLWLYAGDGTPVRRWPGYRKAADVLKADQRRRTVQAEREEQPGEGFKRWSGAAIADGLILTLHTMRKRRAFSLSSPTQFGTTDFVQIRCELLKIDLKADLCLLRFDPLPMLRIKTYKVSDRPPEAVQASDTSKATNHSGFESARKQPQHGPRHRDGLIHRRRHQFASGWNGGSPMLTPDEQIVGVQVLGMRDEIDAVSLETIRAFLPAESPESSTVATITNATHQRRTRSPRRLGSSDARIRPAQSREPMGSLFTFDVDAPGPAGDRSQSRDSSDAGFPPRSDGRLDWPDAIVFGGLRWNADQSTSESHRQQVADQLRPNSDGISYTPDLTSVTVLLTGGI